MNTSRIILVKRTINSIKIYENVNFSTNPLETVKMTFKAYGNPVERGGPQPPPLVMMHGLMGSKEIWRSLSRALHKHTQPQRRVIAVDARNHGDSPHAKEHTYPHLAEDVKALLERYKISKAALLGHSMGGRTMMYFALNNPDLVDKLIVGDISPVITTEPDMGMLEVFDALQNIVLPKNVTKTAARLLVEEQLLKKLHNPGLCTFVLTNLGQAGTGRYKWRPNLPALITNFHEHMITFPSVANLKFTGPVLFITGKKSDFVQQSDHEGIFELFPNAEIREIDGAGHWLYTDKPSEFNEICIEFLNRKS